MFKGIAALFTSGLILKPSVLVGIIFGFYTASINPKDADLYMAVKSLDTYIKIAVVSVIIAALSKDSYEYNKFMPKAFISKFLFTLIGVFIVFISTICFVLMMSSEAAGS